MTMLYILFQLVDGKIPKKFRTGFIKIRELVYEFSENFCHILVLFSYFNFSDIPLILRLGWIFDEISKTTEIF